MKKKDPALWAARRLHKILSEIHPPSQPDPFPRLYELLEEQRGLERCWRLHRIAQHRGWTHSSTILSGRLLWHIDQVNAASRPAAGRRTAAVTNVPNLGDIFAEITHLQNEFDEVEILPEKQQITVTTDQITLEDMYLGSFTIQLSLETLLRQIDATAFAIVANDPNPASSDDTCTHPHVRGEALCAGDATAPIRHALAEGRIGDAFQLVNRVLHTYNPSSPFVSLSDWNGRLCSDCSRPTSSDGAYCCDHCGEDFCDNCVRMCERCDVSVCLGCAASDDNGNRLCPKCKDLADKEQEEAYEEEDQEVDDPVPAEQDPEPQTETNHEHSHSPATLAHTAEHCGVTAHGDERTATAAISPPQAA